MKRTVKRYSLKINLNKWKQICQLARLYRDEKNYHMLYFRQDGNYAASIDERKYRHDLVSKKYHPVTKLQGRQWKIALTNAYYTVDRNWTVLASEIKVLIGHCRNHWNDNEMHYAYWLLQKGRYLAELTTGRAPLPSHFEIDLVGRKRVQNYLRRVIRRKRGAHPVARLARSIELDQEMYRLVEKSDPKGQIVQFLLVMGLRPYHRLAIPLTGYSCFSGNIKIILDFSRRRVEVHTSYDIKIKKPPEGEVVGLDAGTTEVFTDDKGERYERNFGKTLWVNSERILNTNIKRNQLHTQQKKSSKHKAKRIKKYNLEIKKLAETRRKGQVSVRQQISRAIRKMACERKPKMVVTERLDIRGRAQNRKISRIVSYWMRSALKERFTFLALVEGFHHKQVNPAYTSQMCPACLFVDKNNRKGDLFHCQNCGQIDYADRVAANNLRTRAFDPEILVYTPKAIVLSILTRRFIASLERQSELAFIAEPTVPGRTDAHCKVRQSETPTPNDNNTLIGAVQHCRNF